MPIEERAAELAAKKAARRERRDLANRGPDEQGEIDGMDSADLTLPF